MPKDDPKLSQFTLRALSPEQQLKTLLPPEDWPPLVLIFKQRQAVEHLQAIEALEGECAARPRERVAIEREITARREAVRVIEEELARFDPNLRRRDEPTSTTSTTSTSAPPQRHRRRRAAAHKAGELVRRFLAEKPMPGASLSKVRKAMRSWIASEAKRLHRKLSVPSLTTIRRERIEASGRTPASRRER